MPEAGEDDRQGDLEVISANLRNAQKVWGLHSAQYRSCEAILIERLQESSSKSSGDVSQKSAGDGGAVMKEAVWNLPLRPGK